MSSSKAEPRTIPPQLEREMTPAVRDFVLSLLERIRKLEVKLGLNPQNSSLPPSSQHPHARPPRRKRKSKKRHGGQPGHPKHERPLIPSEECDSVTSLRPTECRRCGEKLTGNDPEPLRHQVWELPEIKPQVDEYQQHRLQCPCCGETTCAALPPGVPQGQSGPRLMAFTGLLMAYYRQSKRRTAEFLSTLLGQPCSSGLTVKIQAQVTEALQPCHAELAAELPAQEHVNLDETGSKQADQKTWLWTAVAPAFTVFVIRPSHGADVLDELLQDTFEGIVTCDRAKVYWQVGRLQWCWAHLKRDFQALIDSGDPQARRLGYDLRRATCKLFEHWGQYREGAITRFALWRRMAPVRREVERLLLRGANSGNPEMQGMCQELHGHRDWLWAFLHHEGVEPTNNAAERALRHAVIWRKLSFGTQSAGGSRFMETMLTVIETCRQQCRNAFAFIASAMTTWLRNAPAPSLLPGL